MFVAVGLHSIFSPKGALLFHRRINLILVQPNMTRGTHDVLRLAIYDQNVHFLLFFSLSEKCRVPSWTDRILWCGTMVSPAMPSFRYLLLNSAWQINHLQYNSAPSMRSDHRPVYSLFTVKV
jgi:hypothetical protein